MSVNLIPPPPPSECDDTGLDSGLNSPVINGGCVNADESVDIEARKVEDDQLSDKSGSAGSVGGKSGSVPVTSTAPVGGAAVNRSMTSTPSSSVNSGSNLSAHASSRMNANGGTTTPVNASFTKVLYYFDDVETPYLIKVPTSSSGQNTEEPTVTLGAFKGVVNKSNCKYFVKTMDQELRQTVKEEVMDDNALLPLYNGRIIVYVNSIESNSSHGGGGGSQSGGALSGGESASLAHHAGNRLSGGAGSGHGSQGNQHGGPGSDNGSQYGDTGITDHWTSMRTPATATGNSQFNRVQHSKQPYNAGRNMPPHGMKQMPANRYPPDEDDYTTATDTESFVAPRPGFRGPPPSAAGRYSGHQARGYMHYNVDMGGAGYDSAATSQLTTDYDSFLDSTTDDDESIYRLAGGDGGYWRHPQKMMMHPSRQRRPPRQRRKGPSGVKAAAPSMSSITDSCSSLNLQTVIINMDSSKHLGISIVGQSTNDGAGDGGIYVGEITRDGAVYQEGSIDPGDLIIQANDIPFTNMSNDDAVKVLRDLAKKPGPLKLVVAKLWNSDPAGFEGDGGFGTESLYAMEPRTDLPLLPIDPASWVEASRIATLNGSALSPAVTSDEGSEIGHYSYGCKNTNNGAAGGGASLAIAQQQHIQQQQLNQAAALMNMAAAANVSQNNGVVGGGINGSNLPDSLMGGVGMPIAPVGAAPGGGAAVVGVNSNLVRQSGQGGSGGSAPELREHVYNKNNNQMLATAVQSHHIMNQQSATLAAGIPHHSSANAGVFSTAGGAGGSGGAGGMYMGQLTTQTDPVIIINAMLMPNSGLEIKDRMWLKITIPNAFLGRHFVQWLFDKVSGFSSRNEARSFAKKLLKEGYLKHTTGKSTFSEQCYYVFNFEIINSSAPSSAMYGGAGTISTMQSTLDSSQFGGNNTGGAGVVMGLDATTDNNSSHDGSEENNDLLPPLPTSASVPPSHAHWNLVPPQYTGYTPPNVNVGGMSVPGPGAGGANAQAARYGASTPLPMYTQSSTDYLVNGAPSHMSYSSNVYSSQQQQQQALMYGQPLMGANPGAGGGPVSNNMTDSRMAPPLLQMMNNPSPGAAQSQIRKEFNSANNPQGTSESIFANVM